MKRLTVDEAAAKLGRHPELVRRWLRAGRLKGERIGWSWLIRGAELERFARREPPRRGR